MDGDMERERPIVGRKRRNINEVFLIERLILSFTFGASYITYPHAN
jgi:hypothetical protein